MKKILFTNLLFLLCCITVVNAQTEEESKKWMAYMTPGEVHKLMASWDGEWNESITMWMAPGAPAQEMKSTCVNRMLLGGRYQESRHLGDFGGMPFEGISTMAWDNISKQFINTWIDNLGTGMMVLNGKWDEASKTIQLKGEMMDPMSGQNIPIRQVLKIIDNNTHIMEQYNTKNGKEFKTMEIKFTRK
jgi:hypothetical protein